MADDAGALLVRTGLISGQALLAARQGCANGGGTIGEHLVLGGHVADEALTEFFRSRLLVPRVNPNTLARLSPKVIEAIPPDMAIEFRCVPVALDREGNLTVAMSDPSDRHAVDEVGFFTGKYVVRAVATQMQIAWCLAHYYGHITELGQRLLKPTAGGGVAVAPAAPFDKAQDRPQAAAPAQPVPRVRGFTGRIEASRHKVLAPVRGEPVREEPRPNADVLTPTAADLERVKHAEKFPPAAPPLMPEPAAPPPGTPIELAPPTNSEPYAVVSVQAAEPSKPVRVNTRGRPQKADPPELAARVGEVEVHERPTLVPDALPAVVVALEGDGDDEAREMKPLAAPETDEDAEWEEAAWHARRASAEQMAIDADAAAQAVEAMELSEALRSADVEVTVADLDEPAVIHDPIGGTESQPILLDKPRAARDTVPDTDDDDEPSEPVLLDRPKTPSPAPPSTIADAAASAARTVSARRRTARRTQMGIGLVGSGRNALPLTPPMPPPAPEPPTKPAAQASEPAPPPAAEPEPAAPAAILRADTVPSEPVPKPRPWSTSTPADGVPRLIDEHTSDAATRPHHATPPPISVDDGWGPPGTTIPPPFLGVMPGADGVTDPGWRGGGASIPIADDDEPDEPALLVAAAPPAAAPAVPSSPVPKPVDPVASARALEKAATRLVELLRGLDHVTSRDEVITRLVDYLAESHERVAFFVLKSGALSVFVRRPSLPYPPVTLSLDQPSTFQDVVGTRLPYRGAVADEASRRFIDETFGSPSDEVLILPIAVRDRVVGLLYGDLRVGQSFDEHFAVAGRAAGLALERILQTRRASTH